MHRLLHALLLATCLACAPAVGADRADFGAEVPSAEVRHIADWAAHSGNHAGLPFVVVDKLQSRVFVFDGQARLQGATSALLGLATGDDTVPGIGTRKMSLIRPEERTTPAGRFAASLDRGPKGEEILWVDYESGVALHRVAAGAPRDRRLQRLAGLVPADRRITFGCINVAVKFFVDVVAPTFRHSPGVVYVLPETRSAREMFGSYPVPALAP